MKLLSLIEADPALGEALGPEELAAATQALVAPALRLPQGRWDPRLLPPRMHDALGLLMVDGLLSRTAVLSGRTTAGLLGPGDVIRPWAGCADVFTTPTAPRLSWSVLTPTTVMVLDRRVVAAAARWPSILIDIVRRADFQGTRTAVQVAIARLPRLDQRLMLIFWYVAEHWGRMTPEGLFVPFPLTHETIAAIAAASRPPVSAALTQLARAGLVRRVEGGWMVSRSVEALIATPELSEAV